MRSLLLAVVLVGCTDEPLQVTWETELTFGAPSDCSPHGLSSRPRFFVMDKGDGDFSASIVAMHGTMIIENTSSRESTIELSEPRFEATLHIHRTPGPVDTLDGNGFIARGTCRDEFTLTGQGIEEPSYCGIDREPCALNQGWEWHDR